MFPNVWSVSVWIACLAWVLSSAKEVAWTLQTLLTLMCVCMVLTDSGAWKVYLKQFSK